MSATTRSMGDLGLTPDDLMRMIRAHAPARIAEAYRELVKDQSYQEYPMGQEAARFLLSKGKRLTRDSYRDYESALDKLARFFPDLHLEDFELPVGADRLEEFLAAQWGKREPRTYNKNLSIISEFFKWEVRRGRMQSNPTMLIERARVRDVYRTTFSTDQQRQIIASADDLRDRIALRLLLHYGIRKGALAAVQIKHFDYTRRRLTIFTKGRKVRELPLPEPALWTDLERYVLEAASRPNDYLMARQKTIPRAGVRRFPDKPMSAHGLHDWWYRMLTQAGIVPTGTTAGERMHKARHSAGQRVLDKTGNLKAVQKLLGHSSISTTADVYVDWDIEQLAASLVSALDEDDGTDA